MESLDEKQPLVPRRRRASGLTRLVVLWLVSLTFLVHALYSHFRHPRLRIVPDDDGNDSPYGRFPQPDDPFRFLPCTKATVPPALDDADAARTWAQRFDPDPAHWGWGNATEAASRGDDTYAGRGIYLCGYYDVPLDWTNASDPRITRLAVTKFQAGGLARGGGEVRRSERTIVVEPGGPGGSGTGYVWRAGERLSQLLSRGRFDVLGWDPRGVNATQPAAACFPYDADRDRWWQLTHRYQAEVSDTRAQLEVADAMGAATMRACWEQLGDLGRFVGTGLVARDLDALRAALGEPELTGYLVSYGTGIGQTYANMFPDRVGRVVLDGTEFVPDEWQLGGFGWTSLDNVTHAFRDGFLGECLAAGPAHCALAQPRAGDTDPPTVASLEARMAALVAGVAARPVAATTAAAGPSLVTYSALVAGLYGALYQPTSWPALAQALADLERGNASLAAAMLDDLVWQYDPNTSGGCASGASSVPSTDESSPLVICADAFDAPEPAGGLAWWDGLWANMTRASWISGSSRFYNVLPCRHYGTYWPEPAGVYRGGLNQSLAHPVLLVAETHDPATPLRNGRRLAAAMGHANARLVVHHGYGHSSNADPSACTIAMTRALVLDGRVPERPETHCHADEKPYVYGVRAETSEDHHDHDYLAVWRAHVRELRLMNPRLLR